jgi:hypothetical protein
MMKLKVWSGVLVALMGSFSAQAYGGCITNEEGHVSLSGEYFGFFASNPGAITGTGYVYQRGNTLTFTVEGGQTAQGYVSGLAIKVPAWNLTAALVNNCSEMIWSHGGVWVRK